MSDTPPPINDPYKQANPNVETIQQFLVRTAQQEQGHGTFELESPRMLELNLDGVMNTKTGSMVAYRGPISFKREGMMDQGLGNFLKKAISAEGMQVTYAEGKGKLYLADGGKKIILLQLNNEGLVVNGNDVLAFEPSLEHKITMMKKITGMLAGGLFNVNFSGSGIVAITSHYEPITLEVTPDNPVFTDPNATIAWSAGLSPELKTDVSLKTFFGRGSGESVQMAFQGTGFVVVQPYEEVYMQQTR